LGRAAEIRALDAPEPPADLQSVFQEMLKESPESPLARLGMFWQQVLANDPAAAESLDQVLASGALDATAFGHLGRALRARGLADLADRAKAAAAEKSLTPPAPPAVAAESTNSVS
jgi:hypothetical protein